jgi:protein ImuB
MFWIALSPSNEAERTAWGWWAQRFTPRVAQADEAIVMEVSGSLRLFGGAKRLQGLVFEPNRAPGRAQSAWAATSLIAIALLRLRREGLAKPQRIPDGLPLHLLTAAREHVPTLERAGCTTWGELRALPRGGVARRFGAGLLDALDRAFGDKPESYEWLQLPESFDMNVELATLATSAPELMDGAQWLLSQLQVWLAARNRGVLGLELEWTLDLRRLNGVDLPGKEQLAVRTAQPTQEMAHLRRLVSEHLARATLSAPANHLRLRSLETVPWGGLTTSLLPEDNVPGERLHQLVERLSVRLGDDKVVVPGGVEDHRPEARQRFVPARAGGALPAPEADALYPPWLLPRPLRLQVQGDTPCYGGPLRRLARQYRIETAWWEEGGPALRDYFIARSPEAGLVWIFRERPARDAAEIRWYLQGFYA